MTVNPELMSDEPTHIYNGLKIKLFTSIPITNDHGTAEIMEGEDKGKWTTILFSKLEALNVEKKKTNTF